MILQTVEKGEMYTGQCEIVQWIGLRQDRSNKGPEGRHPILGGPCDHRLPGIVDFATEHQLSLVSNLEPDAFLVIQRNPDVDVSVMTSPLDNKRRSQCIRRLDLELLLCKDFGRDLEKRRPPLTTIRRQEIDDGKQG
jgi:hypothetical protein